MQEPLSFPAIEEPAAQAVTVSAPAPAATSQQSLRENALAHFVPLTAVMKALAEKYRAVAFDVGSTKGMAAAKAARLELRESGRFAVQRLQARLKTEANDLKRVVDDESEKLIAIIRPQEDAVDSQIKAEEQRQADLKAARERAEAERISGINSSLDQIRGYLTHCRKPGMTSERIQAGIEQLEAAVLTADVFQEFTEQAKTLHAETLAGMRQLKDEAKAKEDEAARLEAQRLENERIAAELAAQRAELARQQAELAAREKAEADARAKAEREAAATAEAKAKAERDAATKELPEGQGPRQVLKAEPATADATDRGAPANASPGGGPMGAGQAAAAAPAVVPVRVAVDMATGPDRTAIAVVHHMPDELLARCAGLVAHLALAFEGKFPPHPKPEKAWWDGVRESIQVLQPALAAAMRADLEVPA